MEALFQEQEKLAKTGNLEKCLQDVQKTIDLLVNAREAISRSMLVVVYHGFAPLKLTLLAP